jgi:uncharacterized protein (TIGR02145 family)
MKRLVAVAQLTLCFMLVFCNSGGDQTGSTELVGQWEHAKEEQGKLELFKDGTGVIGDGDSISWKIENKRFVILSRDFGMAWDYNVSGYVLTLIDDDGDSEIFVRKGKLEEFKAKMIAEAKKAKASIGTFNDSRDGKTYKKITVGKQTWMAENLNYVTSGSRCYNGDASNCAKYGILYSWADAKTACPAGWHLPTADEWTILENSVGGRETAGSKLKSLEGWKDNGNGTDEYGFSVLPGGQGNRHGYFSSVGRFGYMWTATEIDGSKAWSQNFDGDGRKSVRRDDDDKNNLASVRCLKD